jgi:hypothetical protein
VDFLRAHGPQRAFEKRQSLWLSPRGVARRSR